MEPSNAVRTTLSRGTALVGVVPVAAVAVQRPGETGLSTTGKAGLSAAIALLLGAAMVTFYRGGVESTTDWILERPGTAFTRGLVGILVLIGVLVVLVFSRIGILLLVPLIPATIAFSMLGLLAGGRLIGQGWWSAVVVAAVLAVTAAVVPVLGGLVGFVVETLGIGGAYLQWSRGPVETTTSGY